MATLRRLPLAPSPDGGGGSPDGGCSRETALSDAIHAVQSTAVQSITLERRRIGDFGISSLAGALFRNASLTQLNLSGNAIGDDGAAALGRVLEHHAALQTLTLENNSIGDEVSL